MYMELADNYGNTPSICLSKRFERLNFLRIGAVKRLNYLLSTTGNMRLFLLASV